MALRIKICGITREEDAWAAIEAGADALGFVFVPGTPRFIEPGRAAAIMRSLPPFISRVGLFVVLWMVCFRFKLFYAPVKLYATP